ncbi:MAG: hypothetical protein CVU87_05165 [Firmicutes bacterium HGW-Firmicutes-12]|jgi:hypothetical protein|nr:MAG: hypothetical protein CVU87_05165 [Firmicutes bacterium HGW-Firmicutes-12]
MSETTIILIEEFISKIKEQYQDLIVEYTYCNETNEYEIWHNDKRLQYENKNFMDFIGKRMNDILFVNNVFNFSFGYDHIKTNNRLLDYDWNIDYSADIVTNYTFTTDDCEEVNFYYPSTKVVELKDIQASIIYHPANRSYIPNILHNENNSLYYLDQYALYDDNPEGRLAA